jgi:hypothetical protein
MTDERLKVLYQNAIAARGDGARTQCPDPERLLAVARRDGSEERAQPGGASRCGRGGAPCPSRSRRRRCSP